MRKLSDLIFGPVNSGCRNSIAERMKKTKISSSLICFCITVAASLFLFIEAKADAIDVSGYIGKTVAEVMRDFPEAHFAKDENISDKDFLTDGKVCFFYDYVNPDTETPQEKTVNRIVLTNAAGAEYYIGSLPGGSTPQDEYYCLKDMGYQLVFTTSDYRNIWTDNHGHLIIVTRGQWAGACETDYSLLTELQW